MNPVPLKPGSDRRSHVVRMGLPDGESSARDVTSGREWLALEPALDVVFVSDPRRLAEADLVVLPGTRARTADLAWLRERGLDIAIVRHACAGRPVLGICGGCQMLGRTIADPHGVGGAPGVVEGPGLLDLDTVYSPEKTLPLHEPAGYEIHHGGRRARRPRARSRARW